MIYNALIVSFSLIPETLQMHFKSELHCTSNGNLFIYYCINFEVKTMHSNHSLTYTIKIH